MHRWICHLARERWSLGVAVALGLVLLLPGAARGWRAGAVLGVAGLLVVRALVRTYAGPPRR